MSAAFRSELPTAATRLTLTALLLGSRLLTLAQTAPGPAGGAPQLGKAPLAVVVAALTPEEKVKLVVGIGFRMEGVSNGNPADEGLPQKVPGAAGRTHAIPRLGIPSLTLADGPAGVRIDPIRNNDSTRTYYATAWPVATLLASSWDTTLVRKVGVAFGSEVRAYGIDVLLAPGMNIHRNPLGGRNFEYYSEDPVVAGNMAAALVNGVESNGVGTSIKHFAVNNQEFNRTMLNSKVSERALREIYLKGFQIAVRKSQPWTVMSSYNLLNGTYTSESHDLLTTLLRQEWGFKGLVMSDWWAGRSSVAQLKAGNDLLMPGTLAQEQEALAALKSGALSSKVLDEDVTRVLRMVLASPTFKGYAYTSKPDLKGDALIARAAAAESMVLLKNDGATLPLPATRRVAVFGNTSYDLITGGTGSGNVNKAYAVSVAQGLGNAGFPLLAGLGADYPRYLKAEKAKQPKRSVFEPVPVIPEMTLEAATLQAQAQQADVALITLGRSAGEGGDRKEADDFTLTAAEQALLRQVAAAFHAQGKKVVVVLNVGGVTEVASWRDQADAILLAWQPGLEGGNAVADLLSGKVTPSGKLATTFPMAYRDVPYGAAFPGKELPGAKGVPPFYNQPSENTYEEGIYVGYRYYNTFKVKPAYEFGYGLSYTTFSYGTLKLSAATLTDRITATVQVTNTGRVAGKEVVQLYVSAPAGKLNKPQSELRAFAKTGLLKPGQSQTLTFTLTAADLASFDPATSAWVTDAGTYTVQVGASSVNIRQRATFAVGKARVVQQSRRLLAPAAPIVELKAPVSKAGK